MVGVIEIGNCHSQWFNSCGGAILAPIQGDVDGLGSNKAALDLVINFRGTLSKISIQLCLMVSSRSAGRRKNRSPYAHEEGSSEKPCSFALSVHQTTPVEALDGSSPACARCPSWALRN